MTSQMFAFPTPSRVDENAHDLPGSSGMTLREYIATAVFQSLFTTAKSPDVQGDFLAAQAVRHADELLKALART
jgi:hypothetical protein